MVFDLTLDELRQRRSAKWQYKDPDVLPLWVAEMDVRVAPPIRTALERLVAGSDFGYVSWQGLPEAYAAFAKRNWGLATDPRRVVAVPDVMDGVFHLLLAGTDPGAKVVINPPVYEPFFQALEHSRRELVEVPLVRDADGRFALDVAGLEAAFAAGARTYLLCSPHNPVGRVWTRAELQTVADLADRFGVLVLADEVHAPLVHEPHTFTPFASLDGASPQEAITFTSASKAWNVPGLKCALAIAGSVSGWRRLLAMGSEMRESAGLLGAVASTVAFAEGEPWLASLRAALRHNRDLLAELLAKHLPALTWHPEQLEATYLAWLDCSPLGLADPAAVFEREGRVALVPGHVFGTGGEDFVRLNFATSPEILEEAVRRMASTVPNR